MGSFWSAVGFSGNPFAHLAAEKEPDLEQYLVRPAYHQLLIERGAQLESFLLFGARGAGKSASRIALYKAAMARISGGAPGEKHPLPVTFDSFTSLVRGGLESVTAAALVEELAFLTSEAVLVWLAALEEAERQTFLESMDDGEERLCVWALQKYYLCRPEAVRAMSSRRAMELLDQAWPKRTVMWIQKRWDRVAAVVGALTEALVQRVAKTPAGVDKVVAASISGDPDPGSEADFVRLTLSRLVDFVRVFGFSGLLVMVDKVDETDVTTNSADATARALHPLLANTALLEIPGLAWVCFLWDKVRGAYSATGKYPIRLDKISHVEINWDERFLVELVERRLDFFSNHSIKNLAGLCEGGVASEEYLHGMIRVAMNSPRELVRLLDTTVREHEEANAAHPGPTPLLSANALDAGIDRYCVEAVFRSYDRVTLAQLYRLGRVEFVNKEVQAASRIQANSARARIKVWCDAGFVSQQGTRAGDGRQGKPAHVFVVTDQRLRRVIERKIWPANQLDLALDPPDPDAQELESGESAQD